MVLPFPGPNIRVLLEQHVQSSFLNLGSRHWKYALLYQITMLSLMFCYLYIDYRFIRTDGTSRRNLPPFAID